MLGLCCFTSFSLGAASRALLWLWCAGFSLPWLLPRSTGVRACGLQYLQHVGSVVGAPGLLEHRLSSCGAWAYCSMWDLPGSKVKPVSPLHWQVDSLPVSRQGSPQTNSLKARIQSLPLHFYPRNLTQCLKPNPINVCRLNLQFP